MTVVVEHDASQLDLLLSTLAGATSLASVAEAHGHLRATESEHVVVVGPSISLDEASDLAGWARIHRPSLGVILLRHRVDSTVLSEAMRSGVREVVEARDLTAVAQATRRALAVAEEMLQTHGSAETDSAASGSVLTVFSTKGGVGKSLVATNLAVSLADRGRSVCLVDLDVQSGDVAIMLQLTPTHQLNDLAAFDGVIDEGAVASLLTEHSPGLKVVAAPVKLDSPDQATPEAVGALIERARHMFDVVVVDTAGTFDDFALVALDRTDTLVLVGTLDIPALKSLKLATGTLDLLNFPRNRWRFVLNRADSKVGLSTKEFEEALGLTADCTLTSSREVLTSVNRGEALVRASPTHANSKAFKSLAESLDVSAPAQPAKADQSGRRRNPPSRRRLLKKGA